MRRKPRNNGEFLDWMADQRPPYVADLVLGLMTMAACGLIIAILMGLP